MTVLEERVKRLQEASDNIGSQAREDLLEQGKKAAANMLLLYGKDAISAPGLIHCVQSAHDAALLWLISEGYVELTEKGRATDQETKERKASRSLALKDSPSEGEKVVTRGAYL